MKNETMTTRRGLDVKSLTFVALMAALCCVLGPLSVPMGEVPVSLQVLAVYLCVYVLGRKLGTLSVCIYLLLGLLGVPVFAGFSGGPQTLFGPTGGYIIGFLFTAYVMGLIFDYMGAKSAMGRIVLQVVGMVAGLAVCYAFGTVWFMFVMKTSLVESLAMCVLPFLLFDGVKIVIAIIVGNALRTALSRANLMHYV